MLDLPPRPSPKADRVRCHFYPYGWHCGRERPWSGPVGRRPRPCKRVLVRRMRKFTAALA